MQILTYNIPGDPISVLRVENADNPRIWDDYKHQRFCFEQRLRNLRDEAPLIKEPIEVEITFYIDSHMKTPTSNKKPTHHQTLPTLLSLFNFVDNAMIGIVYKNDRIIYSSKLTKKYSNEPRTEITIKRRDKDE